MFFSAYSCIDVAIPVGHAIVNIQIPFKSRRAIEGTSINSHNISEAVLSSARALTSEASFQIDVCNIAESH